MFYKIFKFLIKSKIKGSFNRVIYSGKQGEKKIRFKRKNASLKITGNGNKVIFYKNTKSKQLPEGLNLNIIGNYNTIIIHEPNFENTTIDVINDSSPFSSL